MKWILSYWFIWVCSLFLLSCETEGEKYKRLSDEYVKLNQKKQTIESNWNRLKEEQEKCWQSSVKDRYAFLYRIQLNKSHILEYEDYIKSISIQEKDAAKYTIQVKIKPEKKIKPHFHIYLYSRQGLVVGQMSIRPSWLKKVAANKEKEYNETAEISEIPYYFRCDIIDN